MKIVIMIIIIHITIVRTVILITGLDLHSMLESMKAVKNEMLVVQVAAFEDSYEDDLEQLFGPDAAHNLNHYDAFNSLFVKVSWMS